jgi:hypothetical protein
MTQLLEEQPVWGEIAPLLDELPLVRLAKRFAVTPGVIAAAVKRTGTKRRAVESDLPPEKGDAVERTARPSGSKAHLVEAHADKLGKIPDADVARLAGVSTRTIAAYRARHGIPGYSRWTGDKAVERVKTPPTRRARSKIDPFAALVGVEADAVIAAKAEVTPQAVRNYRAKRKIPAPGRSIQAVEAVAVPAAPAAAPPKRVAPPSTGAYAWLLTFESGDDVVRRIALAEDASDLAARAASSGLGPLVAMERLEQGL